MINLINYALLAEQKKYGYFNKINEAYDPAKNQTAENLKLVLSGATDDTYINQWNQLVDGINAAKKANKNTTYQIMILDNNENYMVLLEYTCTDNKVKQSDVKVASYNDAADWIKERDKNKAAKTSTDKEAAKTSTDKEAATSTGPVTKSIKDAAQKIWVALVGSEYTEEEEDVYAVFRDDIKTDADLQSLLAYWKSLKIDFVRGGRAEYNRTSLEKTSQVPFFKDRDITADIDVVNLESDFTLEHWLGSLFNASEINEINNHLSHYSSTRFKAL